MNPSWLTSTACAPSAAAATAAEAASPAARIIIAGPGDPPTALVHPLSYSASHTRVSLGAVNARVCGAATHWQGQLRRAHTYWLFTHDGTFIDYTVTLVRAA